MGASPMARQWIRCTRCKMHVANNTILAIKQLPDLQVSASLTAFLLPKTIVHGSPVAHLDFVLDHGEQKKERCSWMLSLVHATRY